MCGFACGALPRPCSEFNTSFVGLAIRVVRLVDRFLISGSGHLHLTAGRRCLFFHIGEQVLEFDFGEHINRYAMRYLLSQ